MLTKAMEKAVMALMVLLQQLLLKDVFDVTCANSGKAITSVR